MGNEKWDDPLERLADTERHGETGRLYFGGASLSHEAEMRLYAAVQTAGGGVDDSLPRDDVVKLVERIALETVPDETLRATMIKNVMAYIDEIKSLQRQMLG